LRTSQITAISGLFLKNFSSGRDSSMITITAGQKSARRRESKSWRINLGHDVNEDFHKFYIFIIFVKVLKPSFDIKLNLH